jgi:hypothetical protein
MMPKDMSMPVISKDMPSMEMPVRESLKLPSDSVGKLVEVCDQSAESGRKMPVSTRMNLDHGLINYTEALTHLVVIHCQHAVGDVGGGRVTDHLGCWLL